MDENQSTNNDTILWTGAPATLEEFAGLLSRALNDHSKSYAETVRGGTLAEKYGFMKESARKVNREDLFNKFLECTEEQKLRAMSIVFQPTSIDLDSSPEQISMRPGATSSTIDNGLAGSKRSSKDLSDDEPAEANKRICISPEELNKLVSDTVMSVLRQTMSTRSYDQQTGPVDLIPESQPPVAMEVQDPAPENSKKEEAEPAQPDIELSVPGPSTDVEIILFKAGKPTFNESEARATINSMRRMFAAMPQIPPNTRWCSCERCTRCRGRLHNAHKSKGLRLGADCSCFTCRTHRVYLLDAARMDWFAFNFDRHLYDVTYASRKEEIENAIKDMAPKRRNRFVPPTNGYSLLLDYNGPDGFAPPKPTTGKK